MFQQVYKEISRYSPHRNEQKTRIRTQKAFVNMLNVGAHDSTIKKQFDQLFEGLSGDNNLNVFLLNFRI